MQAARINKNGLKQIEAALNEHHKLGGRGHFTPAMLNAWALEAENSFDARDGRPVVVTITADGYDVIEL